MGHVVTYTYDDNNNILSQEGPKPGMVKKFTYDKACRVIKIEESVGDQTLITCKDYDNCGRLTLEIDPYGNRTRFEHDALGRVIRITHPDGAVVEKAYDPLDNLIEEKDGNGHVTKTKYNYRSKPVEIAHPGIKVLETFRYDNSGKLIEHRDINGSKTIYEYDFFGNPIKASVYDGSGKCLKQTSATFTAFCQKSATDGEGHTTIYTNDFAGRKTSETLAGRKIEYFYDHLGRMHCKRIGDTEYLEKFDYLNRVKEKYVRTLQRETLRWEKYEYDEAGNQKSVETPKGKSTMEYNSRKLPTLQTDPFGNKTTFTYGYKRGFSLVVKDPKGVETEHIYDSMGRDKIVSKRNKLGQTIQKIEYSYDFNGNVKEEKHFVYENLKQIKTLVNTWTYGPKNRVETVLESDKKLTEYKYDECGRLKKLIKPLKNELCYEYDGLGRLEHYSGRDFDYRYKYDGSDRVLQVGKTERKYDAFGHVTYERLENGLTIQIGYDALGRRREQILPDKSLITYTYKQDQLYTISRNQATATYAKRDGRGLIEEIDLPYNLGRIVTERDAGTLVKGISSPYYSAKDFVYDERGSLISYKTEEEQAYSYDDLGQLTSEKNHTYTYDSHYNRTNKDGLQYDLGILNEIKSDGNKKYEYDDDGNMTKDGAQICEYDSLDRLIKIGEIEYQYDAFHRRISKKAKGCRYDFIWDGENEIGLMSAEKIEELRILGEGLGAEIGSAVLMELHGKTYVPVHDARGSLAALVDTATNHIERYAYTAFGEERQNPSTSPWRYSSKRVDEETGYMYFGRRYYKPDLGRWLTCDPEGFEDGPNLYAYVQNDPLTRLDLYGLEGVFNDLWRLYKNNWSESYRERRDSYQCNHHRPDFEWNYRYKSCAYHLSRPEASSNTRAGLTLGIMTGFKSNRETVESQSDKLGGVNIHAVNHPTRGFFKDLWESVMLMMGRVTPACMQQIETWKKFFNENPLGYYFQVCHSRGAGVVRNSLAHLPQWMRERIVVMAIAPMCFIPENLCLSVRHYVSDRDIVPLLDRKGREMSLHNTTVLKSVDDPNRAWWDVIDHGIMNKTYEQPLASNYDEFVKKYGGK